MYLKCLVENGEEVSATRCGVDMVSVYEDGGGGGLYPFHPGLPMFIGPNPIFSYNTINISELVFLRSTFGNTLVLLIPLSRNLTKAGSLRKC